MAFIQKPEPWVIMEKAYSFIKIELQTAQHSGVKKEKGELKRAAIQFAEQNKMVIWHLLQVNAAVWILL